ncbi:hypothetical protein HCH_01324 [Hahella chejuensis KCTC 2396]|uniref:Uncharacterized protein n=1 Tax=Hahella chejuensis (strain KCTC 2396) TaxID=349521 RepID=Q2SMD3_HAHCH|nr:hypothetical protein [Hahella chejuensis]ABC28191.1 hypothetical protein HCH_01324 [Hahella chejuensis KCTC 2396]
MESGAAVGYVRLDIDTFVMETAIPANKACHAPVSKWMVTRRSPPIWGVKAGVRGWMRPGKQHSMKDSDGFLRRVLPRAQALTTEPLLIWQVSGFCNQKYLWALRQQREQARADGYVVKGNPRSEGRDMAFCVQLAEGQ